MTFRDILLAVQYITLWGLLIESIIIFRRWKDRLHGNLLLSCLAALVNNLGYLFEFRARTQETYVTAVQLSYAGRVWFAFFLFLFVCRLTGIRIKSWITSTLVALHVLCYIAVLTVPDTSLYYTWINFTYDGTFGYFTHGNGIMHHVHMALNIGYIVLGLTILLVAVLRESGRIAKRRLITVFISVLAQAIFFTVQMVGIPGITDRFDITIMGYFVGTILMLVSIVTGDLLGTIEIAKGFVIDRISEPIIAVDTAGTVKYYNEPAGLVYPDLQIGKEPPHDIVDAAENGKTLTLNDRIYTPEKNVLVYRDEDFGKLYSLVDDTDHYKYMEVLEEQKKMADSASVAKSRFLANMSHEIRTPINAVLGMDEMILRESGEKEIRNYAASIQSAGKALLSLINDILDFSKVEEGRMEIIPVQYELSSLVNDLVNMIKERAVRKGLKLSISVDPKIPHVIVGDEIRIRQCVMNLLTNAVKYTLKGSVTLRVGYEKKDDKSIMLSFSVEDTGIGMKKEDMEKLFSPYERIDEKRNRSIEGTGLGMSITRQLLDLMGSSLSVESEYGEGSRFSFAVEQEVVSWDEIGDYSERLDSSDSEGAEYHELFRAPDARILVVDDNETNLSVVKSLLKQTRLRIDTADSGADALALAKVNDYDAMLIDHMMSDMDGLETLAELRKLDRNRETPAVALTANAVSGAREMYLAAGFTDYLSKPVEGIKLEKMLKKLLPKEKLLSPETVVAETPGAPVNGGRPGILVIDDDETVCALVKTIMEKDYEVRTALSGAEGIRMVKDSRPDLLLLDVHLNDGTGFEIMEKMRLDEQMEDIPVLMITGDDDHAVEESGFKSGAADYIRKPFAPDVLKQRVKRIIDLDRYRRSIEEEVEKQTSLSIRLGREMMQALSKTVDTKDHYTDGHSRRVAAICAEIGRRLGMDDQEQILLYEIGLLHDIGKIGVSEEIIHKNTRLSDSEFTEVKEHTVKGYEILKDIVDMPRLCEGARWHHERFDGSGYPDGLKGEEIPVLARIACIADCYDAMTSTRTYSVPRRQEDVRAEILRCRDTWFDPKIADVMLTMIDEDTDYRMNEQALSGEVWKNYERLWGKINVTRESPEEKLSEELKDIPGIDIKTGLKNCGSKEGYLSVMGVFKQTAAAKAGEIEELYRAGNITDYTVKVHALKSSARIIGALELSKLAEELENAGKTGDRGFIDDNTGKLLELYRRIDRELSFLTKEDEDLPEIGPEALREAYRTVTEIAGAMDYELMEGLLKELHGYRLPPKDAEIVAKTEKLLTELDWDGIIETAKTALSRTDG